MPLFRVVRERVERRAHSSKTVVEERRGDEKNFSVPSQKVEREREREA
jgi:hypothetical protein